MSSCEPILSRVRLAAKRAHGLAAALLLRDSLAPHLSFPHFSTLRRNFTLRQRGSCDAYGEAVRFPEWVFRHKD